jgi:hypothetical protein
MKSSLTFLAVFVVVLAAHAAAIAGPGDPRLVNGVLEWPRALTNEPFVVVRGDDGALYYVTITAARRDATLAGGARIAVLGLEGRTPHEITALGVGVGDSVESALANLQGAKPAAAASAPAVVTPPIATAPTPPTIAAPTSPNGAAPTAAAPAPPPNGGAAAIAPGVKAPSASTQVGVVPPTRTPAAATNIPAAPTGAAPTTTAPTPTTTAPTPTTTAPTPTTTAPAPTTTAPAPNAAAPVPTAPAPAVTPTTPGFGPYPAVISAPTAPPAVSAAAAPPKQPVPEVAPASAPMPSLARDDRRWTEVTGVVEAINGRTLVLRSTEGRIAVDMSNLSSNLERILTPGATVRVYGLPVEVRFKAMGFVSQ